MIQKILIDESQYKKIPGFEDYAISKNGDIISYKYGYIRKLKLPINSNGYYQVCLYDSEKKPHRILVNRLVLLTFTGPPEPHQTCTRHLDGNPLNNNISNLCWGTTTENMQDRIKHGTLLNGEKNHFSKLTTQTIYKIIKEYLNSNHNLKTLALKNGVTTATISNILQGHTWKHLQISKTSKPAGVSKYSRQKLVNLSLYLQYKILLQISSKNKAIFEYRYGIGTDNIIKTLQDTGNKFNITRERVRQIINSIIKKIECIDTASEYVKFLLKEAA